MIAAGYLAVKGSKVEFEALLRYVVALSGPLREGLLRASVRPRKSTRTELLASAHADLIRNRRAFRPDLLLAELALRRLHVRRHNDRPLSDRAFLSRGLPRLRIHQHLLDPLPLVPNLGLCEDLFHHLAKGNRLLRHTRRGSF